MSKFKLHKHIEGYNYKIDSWLGIWD